MKLYLLGLPPLKGTRGSATTPRRLQIQSKLYNLLKSRKIGCQTHFPPGPDVGRVVLVAVADVISVNHPSETLYIERDWNLVLTKTKQQK